MAIAEEGSAFHLVFSSLFCITRRRAAVRSGQTGTRARADWVPVSNGNEQVLFHYISYLARLV